MRSVMVDHARARQADKRGGDWQQVTLTLSLHGEDSVALTTGGDALVSAGGKLTTEAQHHAISVLRGGTPGGAGDVASGRPGKSG